MITMQGSHPLLIPVVLCGGSGTRLWPRSRQAYPKQLLPLSSELSLLQETMQRLAVLADTVELAPPIVIGNEQHSFVITEQLSAIKVTNATIILEPEARNTAPAITFAALIASSMPLSAILLILPSDHVIKNLTPFCVAIQQASQMAALNYLVTLGIQPIQAATGYGYLKRGQLIPETVGYQVSTFIEKPDAIHAIHYLRAGDYYWNSGIFLLPVNLYLDELKQYAPSLLTAVTQAWAAAHRQVEKIHLERQTFTACENNSIDYVLMEKSQRIAVVPLSDSGWSDLGSWEALYDYQDKDSHGNVVQGDVTLEAVSNSYLRAESRLLAVAGLQDQIVIETADAVLVANKQSADNIKQLVQKLATQKRPEMTYHRQVQRPWGYYELLDDSASVKVKRIVVKVGAALSLQMHRFRAEHWIIIQGTAEVTCGDNLFLLTANQSTYIPALTKHRLKTHGQQPLILIEVQTGSYLGEDDIVRFDDDYGRVEEDQECLAVER